MAIIQFNTTSFSCVDCGFLKLPPPASLMSCAPFSLIGLDALGLELFVAEKSARLPTVTTVRVPDGVDWKAVVKYAMQT